VVVTGGGVVLDPKTRLWVQRPTVVTEVEARPATSSSKTKTLDATGAATSRRDLEREELDLRTRLDALAADIKARGGGTIGTSGSGGRGSSNVSSNNNNQQEDAGGAPLREKLDAHAKLQQQLAELVEERTAAAAMVVAFETPNEEDLQVGTSSVGRCVLALVQVLRVVLSVLVSILSSSCG
jgi:hypothetical protein